MKLLTTSKRDKNYVLGMLLTIKVGRRSQSTVR